MQSVQPTVFLVGGEPHLRGRITARIGRQGWTCEPVDSADAFLAAGFAARPGCVVVPCACHLLGTLETRQPFWQAVPRLPVILVCDASCLQATIESVRPGVFRVLQESQPDEELNGTIMQAMELDARRREATRDRRDFESRLQSLESRERLALELILAGNANKSIKRKLELSERTIDRIRSSILRKMQFLTFVELSMAYGASRADDDLYPLNIAPHFRSDNDPQVLDSLVANS